MNQINMFLKDDWDEYSSGDDLVFHDDQISNLSLIGQIDVTGQSIPLGTLTFDINTDVDLSDRTYLIYENYDGTTIDAICKWIIKNVEPVGEGCVRITAEPFIGLLDGIEITDVVAMESYSMEDVRRSIVPKNEGGYPDNWGYFYPYCYLPTQSARERMIWMIFGDGVYFSCYGTTKYKDGEWTWPRTGETTFNRFPIPEKADLIPSEYTFRGASFSFRERVKEVKLTGYNFVESPSMLLDENDYRFPEPWTTIEAEFSSDDIIPEVNGESGPIVVDGESGPVDVEAESGYSAESDNFDRAKGIVIDNIYTVSIDDANEKIKWLAAYYLNPRELTVDAINAFEYCAGERVIVYAANDRLVSGIIERADYRVENSVRSTLKLVCVEDVPGAWLTLNYTVNGNVIGHDRRYLPVGQSYSVKNYNLLRYRNGRVITYEPQQAETTGEMGEEDQTVAVAYGIKSE